MVATITGDGAKDLIGLTLVGSGGGGPPAVEGEGPVSEDVSVLDDLP